MGKGGKGGKAGTWTCSWCGYYNWSFRDVCKVAGCNCKRPEHLAGKNVQENMGNKDKTIAELRRQLKEKEASTSSSASGENKAAEAKNGLAEELAKAKQGLSHAKGMGSGEAYAPMVRCWEEQVARLQKQVNEAKPIPVQVRQIAEVLQRKLKALHTLETDTLPGLKKKAAEVEEEIVKQKAEVESLRRQQAERCQEQIGPGFPEGQARGAALVQALRQMAGESPSMLALAAMADTLQLELDRLQQTKDAAQAEEARAQQLQQEQQQVQQQKQLEAESMQVDEELRVAVDAAVAAMAAGTGEGGSGPDAAAARKSMEHMASLAGQAAVKKARLGPYS